jgi:phosphoglycerate dehydrogenase-like enzyme
MKFFSQLFPQKTISPIPAPWQQLRCQAAIMSIDQFDIEWQKANIELGIIGMGDMGRMYANRLSQYGWKR